MFNLETLKGLGSAARATSNVHDASSVENVLAFEAFDRVNNNWDLTHFAEENFDLGLVAYEVFRRNDFLIHC